MRIGEFVCWFIVIVSRRRRASVRADIFEEYFYDDDGALTEMIDTAPGGAVLNIPAGQWHSLRSLESGTVLLGGERRLV